jgi:prolyl oligopeptidase
MRNAFFILLTLLLILQACNMETSKNNNKEKLSYPVTYRDTTVVDDYHGIEVADPYRWLEDDNAENTLVWVKEQNDLTFSYLDRIPFRDKVKDRLTELLNYERFGTPFKKADKYYFYKNDGLQNQSVLYVKDSLEGEASVVLNPNGFSDDGTVALSGISFDKDGKYLGYTTSEGGSDWVKGQVLDLATGETLEEEINWIKFSGLSWYKDGFFYSRYPAPDKDEALTDKNEFHKLYYHKLGSPQEEDVLWYEDKDYPNRNVYAGVSEDERFLIVSKVESTTGNALSVFDLEAENPEEIVLVDDFEKDYNVIDHDGDELMIQTNWGAPNMRIMKANIARPGKDQWVEMIPEASEPMKGVTIAGEKMFISYLKNAYSLVKVFDLQGNFLQNLELPGIGSIGGLSGEKEDTEAFFSFSSFTMPSTIYTLNTDDLAYDIFIQPEIDFDSDAYTTDQVWYESKDGTKVPMFITHKKDLKLDGTNPTLLYGYGGFDISVTPRFSTSRIPLLENGGILVIANIRGGGEFGEEWHLAGTLGQKQNVFDDFISAAEYLVENKYTSSDRLAIQGGSNGGLLVGACMTQRPDLFAVTFPQVGVLDMLRYHKFTIGWAWATDYGKSDDPDAFEYLYKYSPLHNIREIEYPATLVTTADHDDRVVPAHSFKFIAELQSKQQGSNPTLIRIETSAGHGAGKPISKQIEETADVLSFMWYNMDFTPKY